MKLRQLDILNNFTLFNIDENFDNFSIIFKFTHNDNEIRKIKNLENLSIGALLEIGNSYSISNTITIIKNDLNLKCITENDLCNLYLHYWNKKLLSIQQMFGDIDKGVIMTNQFGNEWNRACQTVVIPFEITTINSLAIKMNKTYDEISKLKWIECYFRIKCDKRNEYFEYLCNEKNKIKQ